MPLRLLRRPAVPAGALRGRRGGNLARRFPPRTPPSAQSRWPKGPRTPGIRPLRGLGEVRSLIPCAGRAKRAGRRARRGQGPALAAPRPSRKGARAIPPRSRALPSRPDRPVPASWVSLSPTRRVRLRAGTRPEGAFAQVPLTLRAAARPLAGMRSEDARAQVPRPANRFAERCKDTSERTTTWARPTRSWTRRRRRWWSTC